MSEEEPNFGLFRNPITWGIVLTLSLGLLVYFLGSQLGSDGKPRYIEFLEGQPNTIGDTLAGIFAPLAFIWIVVTVFLQSHELREQRRELAFSREELKLAREAQQAQLLVMQKQADIFGDEQRQRLQMESQLEASELLRDLIFQIDFEHEILGARWKISSANNVTPDAIRLFSEIGQVKQDLTEDQRVRNTSIICFMNVKKLKLAKEAGTLVQANMARGFYEDVATLVDRIVSMKERLSQHQQFRMTSIGIATIETSLNEILSIDVWKEEPA